MKRILLIICMLLSGYIAFSQEYNCIINDGDFEGVKAAVLDVKFENDRVKNGIEFVKRTKCCFTSAQVYQLAESFSFASNLSSFLKGVYDNIVDDQSADFYKLLSLFKFESDKNSFSSYIASHRSACSAYDLKHKRHDHSERHDNFEHHEHGNMQEFNCAITNSDFEGVKSALQDIAFEDDKTKSGIELVKRTNCCFTSRQIYELAEGFAFEENLLKFLKGVYDNILDDQSADFYKILSLFKFEDNKTQFSSFISSHRSACSAYEIKRHHNPKPEEHVDHYQHKDENTHMEHQERVNNDANNTNVTINAHFDDNNASMSVSGQENANVSININVPNPPANNGTINFEWVDPSARLMATDHSFKRIKAKVYCKIQPEIVLIIDNNIINQPPEKVVPLDDKGFIYTYYINFHKGENHIFLRVVNPSDKSYIYSEERIIDFEKE